MLSDQISKVAASSVSMDEALLADQKTFVARGYELQPSANNSFRLGGPVALYVEVYEPAMLATSAPQIGLEYEVIDRKSNQPVANASTQVSSFGKLGNPVVPVGIPLKLDNVPAGTYEIEIRAFDSAGNRSPVQHAQFVLN
jgi:hypothetical protein